MTHETERPVPAKDEKGRFISGNIGGGRPKGARSKLSEAFIEALADDFDAHGAAVIQTVREEKPDQYLKVVASLMPKDMNLHVDDVRLLTDDELDVKFQRMIVAAYGGLPRGDDEDATPVH